MEGMKCGMCTNTPASTAPFNKLSLPRHFRQFIIAGVLAPFSPPSSSIHQAPFRSQPFRQYSSPYSATCLSTTDTSPITRQGSQTQPDDCDDEPSAEPGITPAKAPPAAIKVDGLRIFECNNKEPAERRSSGRPIIIPDSAHEISSGQKCQGKDDVRSLRKQPAYFRYPPGFFQPEFLDIDGFELDNTSGAIPTDSREQLYVQEPSINHPFGEIRAMTGHAELKGEYALGWEILDDGNDSPYFTSAPVVTAGSAAQQSDILIIQALKRQHQESQAGLNPDGDAAAPVDVEPSNNAKGISAPESTHVAGNQSVMPRGQDDREHEIDGIIGKEEVNGEVYYWVNWTPTLMPLSELGRATDLVGDFKAGLPAQRRHTKGERKRPKLNRGRQTIAKSLLTPEKPPCLLQLLAATKQAQHGIPAEIQKPRRGRPRKQ